MAGKFGSEKIFIKLSINYVDSNSKIQKNFVRVYVIPLTSLRAHEEQNIASFPPCSLDMLGFFLKAIWGSHDPAEDPDLLIFLQHSV